MPVDNDEVLIVGAGPAGISAALALAEQGRPVRLIDPARATIELPPRGNYQQLRASDSAQWRWQLGDNLGRGEAGATSPKLRVPGLAPIFADYARENWLRPEPGFHLLGAMAVGGLSNAWGCGVARFDESELAPLSSAQMDASYARVARRMGLSGASDDGVAAALGVDGWAEPGLPLDALHAQLLRRRDRVERQRGVTLGRSRLGVLASPRPGRSACDLSGLCLWGCPERATWSAAMDLQALLSKPNVVWEPGWCADRLQRCADGRWDLQVHASDGGTRVINARRIVLAAGTIATTRLVLAALPAPPRELRLLSNPMAAFLLCLPAFLGQPRRSAFGLAQLSARVDLLAEGAAWAHLFSTAGLPVTEFLPYLPITRRAGLPLLRALLPATIVGNVFFPGALSAHTVALDADGGLRIRGGEASGLASARARVRTTLEQAFRRAGAWMLPGSFVPGGLGADLHYASTLPIRPDPRAHECHRSGEVAGLPGVYVVDGASLPALPAKSHTLTIMANADRIARSLQRSDV